MDRGCRAYQFYIRTAACVPKNEAFASHCNSCHAHVHGVSEKSRSICSVGNRGFWEAGGESEQSRSICSMGNRGFREGRGESEKSRSMRSVGNRGFWEGRGEAEKVSLGGGAKERLGWLYVYVYLYATFYNIV